MSTSHLWVTLERLSIVAVLLVAGFIVWREVRSPPPPPTRTLPREPVAFDGAPIEGAATARLGLMVFSDFECRFCAKFARETLPDLRKRYVDEGRVVVIFRHLPLEAIHSASMTLAKAAECAAQQGRFSAMHDLLFAPMDVGEQIPMSPAQALAARLRRNQIEGLDIAGVEACLAGGSIEDRIRRDMAIAAGLGIRSTPVFLIGSVSEGRFLKTLRMLRGARPLSEFVEALDSGETRNGEVQQ